MEYYKTERGGEMLVYRGYLYIKESKAVTKTIWKCREWCKHKCKGRVHIFEGDVLKSISHNHVPDASKVSVVKVMTKLKEKASATDLTTSVLAADTFVEIPEAAVGQAPSLKNIKRRIQRCRNQVSGHPSNPRNLSEFVLVDPYTSTADGQRFLLHDSGIVAENRILIFGTTKGLDLLVSSPHWFADGTFKTVPAIFRQLYTLHVMKYAHVFPTVYVLMTNRTEESYRKILQELKVLRPGLNPSTIMMDFERSAIASFEKEFPNAELRGCFFHFAQCLWRKVQESGLQCKYAQDAEYAVQVKMLSSLAFVPEDTVVSAFEALLDSEYYTEHEEELLPLMNYFEDVWVGRKNRRGVRQKPMFPHKMWNLFDSVKDELPKTNNAVEGWHTSFSSMIGAHHLSIYPFIDALKKSEVLTRQRIQELECGGPANSQKKVYRDNAERIKKIVEDYAARDKVKYLRALARNFNLQV